MTVLNMDCIEGMRLFPDAYFDSIVCDPPYELGFMGKSWDASGIAYSVEMWAEALRVLKPGGHLLAFSGSRTYHRMVCAIEDAGFEIRDQIMWVYGSGFPKSLDVSKALEAFAKTGRSDSQVTGDGRSRVEGQHFKEFRRGNAPKADFTPTTDAARQWQGWGTALKPAHEPIVVARKPLIGTVAANVLQHGTGAINVDGCRITTTENLNGGAYAEVGGRQVSGSLHAGSGMNVAGKTVGAEFVQPAGRWPANFLHDGSISEEWSRYFYCAKASKTDRNSGGIVSTHPTVKPTDLMRYLCRLVTPPGGTVLDPFTGSGSTGKAARLEGFGFIGFELSEEYTRIATARIAGVTAP